ncbi:MAG: TolC family protein [Bacteroidota bacterium]
MKMWKIILSTVFLLSGIAAGQDSMTVEQAVQRVLQTHPAIEQAVANIHAAEARTMQASSAKLPDVMSQASYAHIGPLAEFSFPVFGTIVLAPADNYNAHVAGEYTFYDFGKTSTTVTLSKSREQTLRDAMELTKTNLSLQTIRVFYTIILLQKSMKVQDEQIEALNQHLTVTQKRVEAGTATSFDVLTTQVRVAGAQNQKVDIQNSLQKQEAMLGQLLSLPTQNLPSIHGSFQQTRMSLNIDSLSRLALEQRTELKLAHDAEQSAERQKELNSLGNMPTLKVSAVYALNNGYEPNIYPVRGNWVWGAQAQVPIFDGGRVGHQEEEAQAAVQAEQAHGRDVEGQIRSDVEQVVADVQAAVSKVQISEIQLQQAHDAVAIARTQYETGSITNLDLLDAETAESAAKLMYLQALYHFTLSKYELDRAIGASFID